MKKLCFLLVLLLLIGSASACAENTALSPAANVLEQTETIPAEDLKPSAAADKEEIGYQLDPPERGEEICVLHTDRGDIKFRFFPEAAPKAVYNFKSLVLSGYYDGTVFHRVCDDFMIQGGDPTASGYGGESIWGTDFEDEFHENLLNITGAVSCANSGPNTNGSQFFINATSTGKIDWDYYEYVYQNIYKSNPDAFTAYYGSTLNTEKINDKYKELYAANGGNAHLDGAYSTAGTGHTVFGQVFEGLDIVREIETVETDENDKPLTDCVIRSAEIVLYE